MTQLMDDYSCPQPESGKGLHIQESGEEGLSSDMGHTYSDNYTEKVSSPVYNDSFVRPILNEESIAAHALVSEHRGSSPKNLFMASESHHVPAECTLLKLPPLAEAQKAKITPKTMLMVLSEDDPKTTALTTTQPDVEIAEDGNMNIKENPVKPRGLPMLRQKGRGRKCELYLRFLAAMIIMVPGSVGFPVRHFTCDDQDRCLKLVAIYDDNGSKLFDRLPNEIFPKCPAILLPTPDKCAVCKTQSTVTIICPEAIRKLEVEGSDGLPIGNITPVDQQQPTDATSAAAQLMCGIGVFSVAFGVLVI